MLFCKIMAWIVDLGLAYRQPSQIEGGMSSSISGCLSVGHKRRGMSYAKPVRICGENIESVLMSVEATPKKSV